MSNFLNIYKKYKKEGGVRQRPPGNKANSSTQSIKHKTSNKGNNVVTSSPTTSTTTPLPIIHNISITDIADNNNNSEIIEKANDLVNKIKEGINSQLINNFDIESSQFIVDLNNAIDTSNPKTKLAELDCYVRYMSMCSSLGLNNISNKLKQLYLTRRNDYDKVKFYLDAYDVIHDVAYIDEYVEKLGEICQDVIKQPFVYTKNEHKLRENREKLVKDLLKKDLGDIFPIENDKILTKIDGYAMFFQEIYKVSGSSYDIPFTYRESGRELSYEILIKYYKNLNDSEKKVFKKLCVYDNALDPLYNHLFNTLPNDKSLPKPDYEIRKDAISSLDACQQIMNGNNKSDYQTFENVYAMYNYYVLSEIFSSSNDSHIPFHMIIVTYNIKPPEPDLITDPNSIVACFLFQGSPSIDFLIIQCNQIFNRNIPYSRDKKKDEKKDVITSVTSFFVKNKKISCPGCDEIDLRDDAFDDFVKSIIKNDSISDEFIGIINRSNFYDEGYYFRQELDPKEKQLILFGNKTIGDLIFSCDNYKNQIKSLSTTDTFVRASVLYNYLCGNSEDLQSVWRKIDGAGWVYSKGSFNISPEEQSKQLLMQFASVLGFIKYHLSRVDLNMDTKLRNLTNNIMENIFLLTEDEDYLPIIELVNFISIKNCLNIIYQLNSDEIKNKILAIINNMIIRKFEDIHIKLFYSLLYRETQYKILLINKYLEDLSNIEKINLIKSINSMSKLNNIFYMNVISSYENDKSDIEKIIEQNTHIKPSSRQSKHNFFRATIEHFTIFDIDPKLDKVMTEGIVESTEDQQEKKSKSKIINVNIMNNGVSIPLIFKNDEYIDSSNYKQIIIKTDNAYNEKSNRNIEASNIKTIELNKNIFDEGIYYKLVDNTLNYPTLEILLFSSNDLKKVKNVSKLGVYSLPDGKKIHISLWNVTNVIGNLLKLLSLNSIKNDYLSTYLIITQILKNYKYTLVNYTNNTEEACDIFASEIVVKNNESINEIINNLLQLKMNEIQVYEDTLKFINNDAMAMEVENSDEIIKNKLNRTNEELYNLFINMLMLDNPTEINKIKNLIKNKIAENINVCNEIIVNLNDYMINAGINFSSEEEKGEQMGGSNSELIQKYIIQFYLNRNTQNRLIFDGPDDEDKNLLDDFEPGVSYMPEIEEEEYVSDDMILQQPEENKKPKENKNLEENPDERDTKRQKIARDDEILKYIPTSEEIEIINLRTQIINYIIDKLTEIGIKVNKLKYNQLIDPNMTNITSSEQNVNSYIQHQKNFISKYYTKYKKIFENDLILMQIFQRLKQLEPSNRNMNIVFGNVGGRKYTKKNANKSRKYKKTRKSYK